MYEFTDKQPQNDRLWEDLYSFTILTVIAETNISTESDLG